MISYFNPEIYFYPLASDEKRHAFRLFHQAYACQSRGELDQAISNYRQSLGIFPTSEAHTFLGWAYSFQGKYEKAITQCHKAIRTDPDFGNPYNDIGAYLITLGRLDEAIPWLQKAILAKRYETYYFPHFNLGRIWEQKGDWAHALQSYENAFKENPDYLLAVQAHRRLLARLN